MVESEAEVVREQLDRILESEAFAHGERLRRFLKYVVEAALNGRSDRLNQYALGLDVFDRDDEFDPTTDSIVRVEAGRLRSKLAEYYLQAGQQDAVTIALPKGGYAPAFGFAEQAAPIGADPKNKTRAIKWPAAVAALVIVLGIAAWVFLSPPASLGESSIAVLPFENMSANKDQDYFSDGITEDIITDLSVVSGLTVIARHSTFVYKGRAVSIRDIAEELGVRYVLEGSVRREGDRLRITAQLIDAAVETHVWAERFDRNVADVFDVQDEVTGKIVRALEVALTDREKERLEQRNTTSVEAYDLYLRGRERFYGFDRTSVRGSIDLFSQSIKADPGFAEAYAWKARALTYAFISGFILQKELTVDEALILARRAIEIDEGLPMAHANLAWALRWDHQIEAAADQIVRSLELDPNFADAYLWQSLILSTAKNGQAAQSAIQEGFRRNPNYSVTYIFALGRALFAMHDYEAAFEQFERSIERNPNFLPGRVYRVFTLEALGQADAARQARTELEATHPRYEQSAGYRYFLSE